MDALSQMEVRAEPVARPATAVRWRHWTLFLLVLMAIFSMVDKMLITTMLDAIKRDFGLSDTELGLLTGISFSLFFALAGIPLGIAADRGNRRNLIAICITVWSVATMLCGAATGFASLLLLRFAVGAGESGATPSAVSMISDLFPIGQRARALAIYYLFTPIGSGVGLTLGAILVQQYGWREAFLFAGLPGLLIVAILLPTVREPRRLDVAGGVETIANAPPVRDTLRFILAQRALLHLGAGITLVTIAVNAFGMWMFPFFVRVDHLAPRAAGWEISVATYPASAVGMIVVGILADRLGARDQRWRVWLPGLLAFCCLPLAFLAVTASDPVVALALTGGWMVAGISWFGASYAACQSLVLPRMRATLSAILLLLTTLLGFGLGPLITGAVSDAMAPSVGVRSIGYGMVAANFLALWGGIHFMLAGKRLRRDLQTVAASHKPADEPER